jgi:hypothetical protein
VTWTAPPTFITGAVLTAAQLQTVSDDLTDLDRRTNPVADGKGASATTASSSYGNLSDGAGPAVTCTIGSTGKALVTLYASFQGDTVGLLLVMAYQISGAFSYGPSDSDAVTYQVANVLYSSRHGATHVAGPGITPGSCTFAMKYKINGGGTGTFKDRRITVTPLGS